MFIFLDEMHLNFTKIIKQKTKNKKQKQNLYNSKLHLIYRAVQHLLSLTTKMKPSDRDKIYSVISFILSLITES